MIRSTLLALPLALAPLAPTPGPADRASGIALDELEELLDAQLTAARADSVEAALARATLLREAAGLEGEAELDALLDARLSRAENLASLATLLAVTCRLQGEDVDAELVAGALRPQLAASDAEAAAAAAALLGDGSLRRLPPEAQGELLDELLATARDGDRPTDVRLQAAQSAFALGNGAVRRSAREEVLAFLNAQDPDLRARGALSLAAMGDEITGPLARELRRIAALPSARGDLARSYLKQEDIRLLHEDRYRRLEQTLRDRVLPENLRKVQTVLQMIHDHHLDGNKWEDEGLIEAAMDGMLRALDQHSGYMSPAIFDRFNGDLEAEYGGIGAYVGIDPVDGIFTITKPIYSGPAYRAGIGTDDKIVRIDDWPTLGEPSDAIIERLKGRPKTSVTLYVWHQGMDPGLIERPTEEMAVTVTREQISIPAVATQLLPGGIGLVELSTFSRVASQTLEAEIGALREAGMRAMILDLRYNSGGLLTEARNVADLFLEKDKLVVTTDSRVREPEEFYTRRKPVVPMDVPLVVLVNRFTASASEIVSGALQDHERALIVGERTFGKGSVQLLLPLDGYQDDRFEDENRNGRFDNWERIVRDWDGDGEFDWAPRVKMTISRYLLPSGRSIHREIDRDHNLISEGGVSPDKEAEPRRVEAWRLEEHRRIRNGRLTRKYVEERWKEHKETFVGLAECDRRDASQYPDFEEFYEGLETVLPVDDVRYLVRLEVRRRVQDERGAEFPFGDYQEDDVVQHAVRNVLEGLDSTPEEFEEYRSTFLEAEEEEESEPKVAAVVPDRDATLALVEEAQRGDGHLSSEALEDVIRLLSSADRN